MPPLSRFPWPLVRVLLLGAVAVVASAQALVRYYTVELPKMVVPVVDAGGTRDEDAEIPAPDLIEWHDLDDTPH